MSGEMRREFGDREAMVAYLREQFPAAAERDPCVSPRRGGRRAADGYLAQVEPGAYGFSRNFVSGKVTRLSAYLRHGVLGLAEVRDAVVRRVAQRFYAEKLVQELAWRDYYQRLYAVWGRGVWQDREAYKTGWAASDYHDEMPEDVEQGRTGLVCIDCFSEELRETGYLHNHARLWLASYLVHWRRVDWRAGARWFLRHLLDGDPSSNNLGWQWVASTFSNRPYLFNRENLERYTEGQYCKRCPLYGHCDFEGSYEELGAKLFPRGARE